MIAQLHSNSEKTSINRSISPQQYPTTQHHQIRIVDTPAADQAASVENRFCTEIVANALKIASTGKRVLIVQLLKGGIRQGHDRIVNLAQNLDWIRCDSSRNMTSTDLTNLELANFDRLWQHVRSLSSGNNQFVAELSEGESAPASDYSLLILDDLSLAIELGLIGIEAATSFLTTLPASLEIILTGTNPHPAIVELAR
jgi:cob(I)alamin adenosyltransferase